MPLKTENLVEQLTNELNHRGWMLATAESCTGGLIAAAVTDRAGSSSVFDRGFVVYSYESKENLLDVSRKILETHGAVSPECAIAMVQGALAHSMANLAISVTGIAGPGGGMPNKPVGLVYIGWAIRGAQAEVAEHYFSGDRTAIREHTVQAALIHLLDTLKAHP